MRNRPAIVLLSGGLDSAVCLYLAKAKGFRCRALCFDYGQRHKKELDAAKKISRSSGVSFEVIKINLPWRGSALLDKKIKMPLRPDDSAKIPSTYVPGRNIIFLSFALSFAEAIAARDIFIGAHAQDYSGYPDCRPEFYAAFNRMSYCGTKAGVEGRRVKIHTPLINKSKAEIIKLGRNLSVPFQFTWSCYRGGRVPCGRCDSCYYRAKGFKQAGFRDPLINNER